MYLNNASLPRTSLRGETRFITNSNSITYTDADINGAINVYYDLFCTEILESMDDWDFQGEIATASLVANQQEYVFPSDILKIKRIEITYDGSTWYEAKPEDINERDYDSGSVARINDNYDQSEPKYDLMDNSLFIKPIPTTAVTSGLKIWYEKLVTQLSDDTDEPVIPRPFHKGLTYGAAKDYFEKNLEKEGMSRKYDIANQNLETTIIRMKAFYRKKDQDRQYNGEVEDADYDYGMG
jgi:hypothetical protein